MSAKGRIVNTTPRNFWKRRVARVLKPAQFHSGPLKDPGYFHAHRRPIKPLKNACGPGSIFADSQMSALIWAGKAQEAAAFFELHQARTHKCGAWRHSKLRLWYTLYKQGDSRAMGVEA